MFADSCRHAGLFLLRRSQDETVKQPKGDSVTTWTFDNIASEVTDTLWEIEEMARLAD